MVYDEKLRFLFVGTGNLIQAYDLQLSVESDYKKLIYYSFFEKELRNQIISLEVDGDQLIIGDNKLGMIIFEIKEQVIGKRKRKISLSDFCKAEGERRTLTQCCSLKHKDEYLSMDKRG